MGRPKLLLPLGDSTVIARLVQALVSAGVDAVIVVVRPGDDSLRQAAEQAGAEVILPAADPADMRQSVQFALDHLAQRYQPHDDDSWMLVPADHPLLDTDVVRELMREWNTCAEQVLIPTFEGKRGHPTFFRWPLARLVPELPPAQGLNELVRRHNSELRELAVDSDCILLDLDTLEDYERLQVVWRESQL